jgi:hypothetical protein
MALGRLDGVGLVVVGLVVVGLVVVRLIVVRVCTTARGLRGDLAAGAGSIIASDLGCPVRG